MIFFRLSRYILASLRKLLGMCVIRKILVLLMVLVGLLLAGLAAVGFVVWRERVSLAQPLRLEQPRQLYVEAGSTPGGLLARLESEGLLKGAFWLRLYWRRHLPNARLQMGEYQLSPGESAADLIDSWRLGKVIQYRLTLPEGWSFRQVRAALQDKTKLKQLAANLSDEQLMQQLGLDGQQPEGCFFPDTYHYHLGMSDLDVLRLANRRLQKVLDEEWQRRDQGLPYTNPYQALTMASLVEKETGVPEERGQIAGVFVRRLAKGMLLQTDPAVIYGLGSRYQGRISRADLDFPTPYNTYLNPGLPPTPIALAGREAISAALHPAAGEALFFVARGDGHHAFSNTLEEHNRAVAEYQRKRRQDYRSSPPSASEVPAK